MNKKKIFGEKCRILKPNEVWAHNGGTCWDTSLLIYQELSKSNICEQLQAFYFETQDKNRKMLSTHTAVLFREQKSRQFFWFEFSWWQNRGIHGPYNSITQFKNELEKNFVAPDGGKISYFTSSFDVEALLKMDRISAADFLKVSRKEK